MVRFGRTELTLDKNYEGRNLMVCGLSVFTLWYRHIVGHAFTLDFAPMLDIKIFSSVPQYFSTCVQNNRTKTYSEVCLSLTCPARQYGRLAVLLSHNVDFLGELNQDAHVKCCLSIRF